MIEVADIIEAQRFWHSAAAIGGDEAESAAVTAFTGINKAVKVLLSALAELGYPEVAGIIPPESGLDSSIRFLEASVGGDVPPVLAAFWKLVGGISFVDLDKYTHVEFWQGSGVNGPNGYCDGICVDPCSDEWIRFAVQDFIDLSEDPDMPPPDSPYLLSLAPDGYHKDNISGGDPYGVEVGGSWFAPWQNFSWTGARRPSTAQSDTCDFLGYLRTSLLECAGFPALFGEPSFEPIRKSLLENVEVF